MSGPYPPEATTRHLDDPPQPPPAGAGGFAPTGSATGAGPAPDASSRPRRAPSDRAPGLRHRLALLAAVIYLPVILLGYALYLYGPTNCVAGPICALGDAPSALQVALLALGFVLLYLIGVRPLAAALDDRQPARSEGTLLLRRAARYETMRPLLAIFGGLIALVTLGGLFARALTPQAFLIGAGVAALLLWLAASPEP